MYLLIFMVFIFYNLAKTCNEDKSESFIVDFSFS